MVCCVRRQKNLDFSNFFFIIGILGQNQEKVSFLVDPCCSKATKQAFIELKEKDKNLHFFAFLSIWEIQVYFNKYFDAFLNSKMTKTHSLHTAVVIATLYRRSSNTSRILKLVCYFAVIISRCRKLWNGCKHGGKRCSLLWQKRQNSSKISMARLIKVYKKTSVSNIIYVSYIRS